MRRSRFVRSRWGWRVSRAPVSWVLILANVAWFVIVEGMTGWSGEGLLRAGALYAPWVSQGQWFRLISDMFVHMNMLHLAMNMISLASLDVMEVLLGSSSFFTLYFFSGLVGSLCSDLFGPPGIVGGASAAIFGVFGAALALAFRGVLTKAARNQLLFFLVLNLVYGFSVHNVANVAHLGGLVSGMLIAIALDAWRIPTWVTRVTGVFCAVLTLVALVAAIV